MKSPRAEVQKTRMSDLRALCSQNGQEAAENAGMSVGAINLRTHAQVWAANTWQTQSYCSGG